MRYYLIAGEASGDLHASNLIGELKLLDRDAEFRCWGGDMMQQQGAELVKHYRDLAFMGFLEVVTHLPTILKNFRFCKQDLLAFQPDLLILVDYPGFNLRIARFASEHGIRVFYYISPQLWAWRSSRVKSVKKWVEKMFVILPFEKEFYARFDYPVDYAGHPLLDVINDTMNMTSREDFLQKNDLPDRPIVALLPGSRKMEIEKILRMMLRIQPFFPDCQLVIAGAPSVPAAFYERIVGGSKARLLTGQTYDLLKHSRIALVTSGTATLETALMNVPQIVCYKGNLLSYLIARRLIKVKYISLVNLVCGKMLVPELIQSELSQENLVREMTILLEDGPVRQSMIRGYQELKQLLGGHGASSRIAGLMMQYLKQK